MQSFACYDSNRKEAGVEEGTGEISVCTELNRAYVFIDVLGVFWFLRDVVRLSMSSTYFSEF